MYFKLVVVFLSWFSNIDFVMANNITNCTDPTLHQLSGNLLNFCFSCFTEQDNIFIIRGDKQECVPCKKFPHIGNNRFYALHFVTNKEFCQCSFIKAPYKTIHIGCGRGRLPAQLLYTKTRDSCLNIKTFIQEWEPEEEESTTTEKAGSTTENSGVETTEKMVSSSEKVTTERMVTSTEKITTDNFEEKGTTLPPTTEGKTEEKVDEQSSGDDDKIGEYHGRRVDNNLEGWWWTFIGVGIGLVLGMLMSGFRRKWRKLRSDMVL